MFYNRGRGKNITTTYLTVYSFENPIAKALFINDGTGTRVWVVLLTPTHYSMSTSRHQAIVRSVVGKMTRVTLFEVPMLTPTECDEGHDANIAYMMAKVAEERQRCAKARTPETRALYLARAELMKAKCDQYKDVFQLDRKDVGMAPSYGIRNDEKE